MGFAGASVSAAQNPRQPYGPGHLFPSLTTNRLYQLCQGRFMRIYVAGVAIKLAGWFFPERGRTEGE
jgi:hypothetical protein